ncbi:transcription elongation GreA/GreB family factor [Algoriphagus iocasae]|uniref:Transcription elongation GreA/GreB family factor n=1 Tax=Algoriphagus iocasae TaxID=1836499 RepID=A0A841MQW7_9BACT|nr:Lacal_2735 family protein [Algoriphagus iocasae]MBB6324945.1 transcription elongation GreA/GreB family factor [Algoriphagus iocasae]
MFGLFKKKSEMELLQEKYKKLQEEAYKLSTVNRTASDKKQAEAEEVLDQIKKLEQSKA